jgi:diguanylate cyclase (GGDEF)-like protein
MMEHNGGRREESELTGGGKEFHPVEAKISGQPNELRKAVEAQEETLRVRELLKHTIVALSALVDDASSVVNEKLADFKNSVQRATALEEMEKSLGALKDAIARSEQPIPAKAGTAPKEYKSDAGFKDAMASLNDANGARQELQSTFLGLVAEFDHDLGEETSIRLTKLRSAIEKSNSIEDLVRLKDEILAIAQAYNRMINEERTMVAEFISEIGVGLLEVERQYLDSISHSDQSQSENTKFNSLIENHMEDMKKSVQLSTTLAEFRSLVMSKIASIRTALEEKRRSEALRQESLKEEMESLNENLQRMRKEVDQVQERRKALEKEVLVDHLTGVANRRALRERMKNELYRFQRYGHFFSMILFDIDHFKMVNDKYGHWAGDKCLKEIIKRIKPILRETDFIARWGGDEFIIIFPGTDHENAAAVAERIRKLIQNTRFIYHKQEIALTVSIGVSEIQQNDSSQEHLFNRVDKAMYKAKKKGRNMVVLI